MSGAPDGERAAAREEIRRALSAVLAAHRKVRGRDQRASGLSLAQHSLMGHLARRGEMGVGEVAEAAGLAPATVSEMVDGLARAGLAMRVRGDGDRRAVRVRLTDEGRRRYEEKHDSYTEVWDRQLASWSDDELRFACAVLERVAAVLDEM